MTVMVAEMITLIIVATSVSSKMVTLEETDGNNVFGW
jgi:hypothetical protein